MSERTDYADLGRRVRELEERLAIRDLYDYYGWLVDSGQWHLVPEAIFTDDATLVLGEGMEYRGRAEILDSYRKMMPALEATAHYFTNVRIALTGADTATSQAYFQSYHWARETSGQWRPVDFVGVGVYRDQLVRTSDGWRSAYRHRGLLGPGPLGHGALPPWMAAGMGGWGRAPTPD